MLTREIIQMKIDGLTQRVVFLLEEAQQLRGIRAHDLAKPCSVRAEEIQSEIRALQGLIA